jgi:hypothetical protein
MYMYFLSTLCYGNYTMGKDYAEEKLTDTE